MAGSSNHDLQVIGRRLVGAVPDGVVDVDRHLMPLARAVNRLGSSQPALLRALNLVEAVDAGVDDHVENIPHFIDQRLKSETLRLYHDFTSGQYCDVFTINDLVDSGAADAILIVSHFGDDRNIVAL